MVLFPGACAAGIGEVGTPTVAALQTLAIGLARADSSRAHILFPIACAADISAAIVATLLSIAVGAAYAFVLDALTRIYAFPTHSVTAVVTALFALARWLADADPLVAAFLLAGADTRTADSPAPIGATVFVAAVSFAAFQWE